MNENEELGRRQASRRSVLIPASKSHSAQSKVKY